MAASTVVCNMALAHLGIYDPIANLETENSSEARSLRVFYDTTRKAVLRDFNWPFARKIITLALVETTPTTEWQYSYKYPSDSVALRRILSPIRNDTRQSRIPYKEYFADNGGLIYTDKEDAQLEYTVDVTNEALMHPDFMIGLSYRLAHFVAPFLTAGDPFKLSDSTQKAYEVEISKAKANAANEDQPEELPQSEFIRERDNYGPWGNGLCNSLV